jgi:hypothetical protein
MNFRQFDAIIDVRSPAEYADDRVKLPEIHG